MAGGGCLALRVGGTIYWSFLTRSISLQERILGIVDANEVDDSCLRTPKYDYARATSLIDTVGR